MGLAKTHAQLDFRICRQLERTGISWSELETIVADHCLLLTVREWRDLTGFAGSIEC